MCCDHQYNVPQIYIRCIGEEFARVFDSQYGPIDYIWGIRSASTDFVSDFLGDNDNFLTLKYHGFPHGFLSPDQGHITYGKFLPNTRCGSASEF